MTTKCKICGHKDREIIEYLISSGAPRKQLLDEFGINRVNIFTHKFHEPIKVIPEKSPEIKQDSIWDKLRDLVRGTKLSPEEGLDDLIRLYGAKLRTRYDRERSGVTDADFRESDAARQYRRIINMNRT